VEILKTVDPVIYDAMRRESQRQWTGLGMIPSENYVSAAVLAALGSVLTNKYSEGYPGRRYYGGNRYIDVIEETARQRACQLFGAEHANVQPYSGSPANQAVYMALLQQGDIVMGMNLAHGGHLTHGWPVNFSGKLYHAVQYGVDRQTDLIDHDAVWTLAREQRPKLIWVGATAYPRHFDYARFAEIADSVGAVLAADIAHVAGLIAAGVHPSPVPHAGIVTTTTHKTLRGPRGAMIMCRRQYADAIDKAVFPGLQGGPHDNQTAAIAVTLKEAATSEFAAYGTRVVSNARVLADEMLRLGYSLVTGGTDNHLLLVDLTNKGVTGKVAQEALDSAGITLNRNAVPYDPRPPYSPSGIRLGTPAVTSRGMGEHEMRLIARWLDAVIVAKGDAAVCARVRAEIRQMVDAFPVPGIDAAALAGKAEDVMA
jgi:glycine hydroxymethyltransferase